MSTPTRTASRLPVLISLIGLAACTAIPALAQPAAAAAADGARSDPRIRQLATDGDGVIDLPVQRGQLTHVVLPAGEGLAMLPATGQGARCDDEAHQWCIVAQGRDLFIKARTGARTNNLIVVTTQRRYAFELRAVDRGGLMRLSLTPPGTTASVAPIRPPDGTGDPPAAALVVPTATAAPDPLQLLAQRMATVPMPHNSSYTMAVGRGSEDIVPSMVFDDRNFTYLRFAGNRPLPAVFQAGADGSEETVNVRMGEDDLLVADRVARRLILRLGQAVVVLVNEAFDPEGTPSGSGTTVPGVSRSLSTTPRATEGPGRRLQAASAAAAADATPAATPPTGATARNP